MQPEEIVRELYEAFAAKDVRRLRQLIAADVEWNQCPGFPGGKRRRGIDDVLEGILGTNHSQWRGFRADIREYVTSGSSVVVLGAYGGTHADTGKSMRSEFAHVYRVDGERVARFDQIADTWPMVAAMRSADAETP